MPVTVTHAIKNLLKSVHPIYEKQRDSWQVLESRMRGGDEAIEELKKFDWEEATGEHYKLRKAMTTYVNFPDMFSSAMVGHLMKKAPRVDEGALSFGSLGKVRLERSKRAVPTRAEMIYFDTDGVGNNQSQWDNFWANVKKWAMATGHRWIYVEAPKIPLGIKLTQQDELNGVRPYLCHLSPLSVTNWQFADNGMLDFSIIVTFKRRPMLAGGELTGNSSMPQYLLLVRTGYTDLGPEFAAGGWWVFDHELNNIDEGTWGQTKNQIPMFPVYYERSKGRIPAISSSELAASEPSLFPAMSRSAICELGNASIGYMNLSSAADFDAWDGAMSVQMILGADEEGFNLAMNKLKGGSRFIPVPINRDSENPPSVHDSSTGTVASDVFDKLLTRKMTEMDRLATIEASSVGSDASGLSMQAQFAGSRAPRLALMASEMEQAQNLAIWFLELRWGTATEPTGGVEWPREFELVDVLDSVNSIFALQRLAMAGSPSLTAKAMVKAARSRDLVADDAEAKKFEDEVLESAKKADWNNLQQVTADGAKKTGQSNGVGGDGTNSVPGSTRLSSVGANSSQ